MRYVAADEETHLIKPGNLTPRMVCLTTAEAAEGDEAQDVLRLSTYHADRDADETELVHATSGAVDAVFDLASDVSTSTGESRGTFARGIMLRSQAVKWLSFMLADDNVTIVGHNVSFDLAIAAATDATLLAPIFRKFALGLVHDTQIRQQIIDIATGEMKFHVDEDGEPKKTSYELQALALRLLDKRIQKKDTWRLKYALLDGVPLSEWPDEAKSYAIGDAVTTLQVHTKQTEIAGGEIPNSVEQHRAAWGLHLMSAWGIRTELAAVAKLRTELTKDYNEAIEKLRPTGLMNFTAERINRNGATVPAKVSKSMKAIFARVTAAYAAKGLEMPTTPKGKPGTDKKTLTDSGDLDLKLLAESGSTAKLLTTYVPILESGTRWPINPRYNVLVETGRTSCARPNIQNPPRKGGVRECFIPRPGWVYVFSDYDTLELRALAQACLLMVGFSKMAEALRRGEDLHLTLAAEMLKIPLDEAKKRFDEGDAEVKEYRQQAKPANFGFPGGMAAQSFKEYAEGYGIFLSEEQAEEIHETWFNAWPEMGPYFEIIKQLVDQEMPIQQIGPADARDQMWRARGGSSFCAAANGFFQGLAADGAKEAIWRVAVECYVDESSPLYGCRPVFFIHDEIGMEVPYRAFGPERSAAAAQRLSDVMREAMERFIPDVPISCKPIMCRRWYKGAEQVKVNGLLVPAKPVTSEVNGKKRTTWAADTEGLMAA